MRKESDLYQYVIKIRAFKHNQFPVFNKIVGIGSATYPIFVLFGLILS